MGLRSSGERRLHNAVPWYFAGHPPSAGGGTRAGGASGDADEISLVVDRLEVEAVLASPVDALEHAVNAAASSRLPPPTNQPLRCDADMMPPPGPTSSPELEPAGKAVSQQHTHLGVARSRGVPKFLGLRMPRFSISAPARGSRRHPGYPGVHLAKHPNTGPAGWPPAFGPANGGACPRLPPRREAQARSSSWGTHGRPGHSVPAGRAPHHQPARAGRIG